MIDADLDTDINNNENIQIDFSMMETQTSQRSSKSLQSWSLSYEKILLLWNQSNSPWNFAVRLMMEIFPLHELMGEVNVNGRSAYGSGNNKKALEVLRLEQIKSIVMDKAGFNKFSKEAEECWAKCRNAMNKKLSDMKSRAKFNETV
jgi:hypothetical protein